MIHLGQMAASIGQGYGSNGKESGEMRAKESPESVSPTQRLSKSHIPQTIEAFA
jgi:hypothetical protein